MYYRPERWSFSCIQVANTLEFVPIFGNLNFFTVSYEILSLHTFGFFPVIPYDFLKNSLPLYVNEIPENVQYRPALLGNPGDAELF